jgi:hypothetical protein|nr:MAG TPA: hypothetical protein [Caudoviricetes sp.]
MIYVYLKNGVKVTIKNKDEKDPVTAQAIIRIIGDNKYLRLYNYVFACDEIAFIEVVEAKEPTSEELAS